MRKKAKKRPGKLSPAKDLRESLGDMRRLARGEKTSAIVHQVIPSEAKARRAAKILALVNWKPKAPPLHAKARAAR